MQIVAYGGGNNSTAMLIEMARRGEPCDLITFADPGSEWPHTYAFLQTMDAWLLRHAYPAITIVRAAQPLETRCVEHHMLPSIAYGYKSCSDKSKIRPQNRYVAADPQAQAIWDAGDKVTKCIGYHADEPQRATIRESTRYRYRYPLIEWRLGQRDCLATIRGAGLEPPGKSSCTFCPSSTVSDVLRLKRQHPDLLARALAMEAGAHLTSIKGLGRRWSWRELVDADAAQGKFWGEPDAPCGCYDGDGDE